MDSGDRRPPPPERGRSSEALAVGVYSHWRTARGRDREVGPGGPASD